MTVDTSGPVPHINRRDTPPGLLPVVVSPYDVVFPTFFHDPTPFARSAR